MSKALRYSFVILLVVSCLVIVPLALLRGAGDSDDTDAPVVTTTTTTAQTTPAPTTTTTVTTASSTGVGTATSTEPTASTTQKPSTTTQKPTNGPTVSLPSADTKISFPDTLFIGDSRSVGLQSYGKLSDATFFCKTSLSAYSVQKNTVEVPGVGEVTLATLLQKKQFKQVYIMLGINELGYNLTSTRDKYQSLVQLVHQYQPQAKVIVQSTLHVTKECNDITSGSKKIFTNKRINEFNALIAGLANGTNVFYLDMNPAFDDAGGNLNSLFAAGDGIHFNGKGYLVWRDYLDKNRIA